jgi:hypothetical protein
MKPLLAFAACLLLVATADADSRQARIDSLKQSFHFDAATASAQPVNDTDEDVVVLDKITVTESMARRTLAARIESKWARDAADQFSWKTGGALFRSSKVDAGVWVSLEENTVGVNSAREIKLKVELLRIKW